MLTRTDQSRASQHFLLSTEIKSRQGYQRWRVWYTPETQCGWKIKGNNAWQLDNKAEHRYCATKREMLNLFWALREFYPYLYGGLFLESRPQLSERRDARWLESLAELEFNTEHRLKGLSTMQEALNSGRLDICIILHQSTICRDTGLDKNQENSNGKVIPKQASNAEIQLLKNSIWSPYCPVASSRNLAIDNGLLLCHRKEKIEHRSDYQDHFDQRYLALCFIEHLPRPFWREKTAGPSKKPLLLTSNDVRAHRINIDT
ncbi:hypothetical protein T12_17033 [Trichinella patagoniensis]|uniref:Uncharacterized protein n=1 Tax=Trichinella patagoniensis TaxID=990121 RepID=A0A0V0ZVY0_9BILA|nr:hypothetical protein T12_17033 [Trichinella patagoniensis]